MLLGAISITFGRVALRIGSVEIYWYGVFVALAFLTALTIMHWQAAKRGLPGQRVADLTIPAILGGLGGARLLYVITRWHEFRDQPLRIFAIRDGGLVFYGGFAGAALAVYLTVRWMKLDVGKTADVIGIALPAGQAVGRWACLLNGCCFGCPVTAGPALLYRPDGAVYATQVAQGIIPPDTANHLPRPVVPVQLYQSLTNLVLFAILLALAPRCRRPGTVFALYLTLYPLGRFINEFNRGDYMSRWMGLTPAQVVSLAVFPAGIALLLWLNRGAADNAPQPPETDQAGSDARRD